MAGAEQSARLQAALSRCHACNDQLTGALQEVRSGGALGVQAVARAHISQGTKTNNYN